MIPFLLGWPIFRGELLVSGSVFKIYAAFLSDMAVVGIEEPIIAAVAVAACYVWLVFSDVADHMQSLEMTNLVVTLETY